MSLHQITTTQQFLELKESWEKLTTEPLRSFSWHASWWKSFGDSLQLHTYCYIVDGETVGIAPFFVDRWMGQSRLRFIGSGVTCTDYVDVIAKPEFKDEFINAIADAIGTSKTVTMLELEGVSGVDSEGSLSGSFQPFWQYESELDPTWVIALPPTWEEFQKSSKKSLRRKIKKAQKRLDKGEVVVRSTQEGLEPAFAFETLVELHQQRFVSKGAPGAFADPRFTSFLQAAARELIQQDKAEITVGFFEDRPFVAQFYLFGESGPQLYQAGASVDSMSLEPGHLMITHAVQKAIAAGHKELDLLRGSEAYKIYWGAKPQKLLTVRCVSRSILPTFVNQSFIALQALKYNFQNLFAQRATASR